MTKYYYNIHLVGDQRIPYLSLLWEPPIESFANIDKFISNAWTCFLHSVLKQYIFRRPPNISRGNVTLLVDSDYLGYPFSDVLDLAGNREAYATFILDMVYAGDGPITQQLNAVMPQQVVDI